LQDFASILPLSSAPVDLNNPHNCFTILEQFDDAEQLEPQRIFFCRLIGHGQSKLKSVYDIKTRRYIGNTTMDPELAFIQSNVTSIRPDDLVLDPFMGTGEAASLQAAEFGAYTVGTEINYQIAKAIGELLLINFWKTSVFVNQRKYVINVSFCIVVNNKYVVHISKRLK
uniref:UPF0020 domain-containing protein n=1 Tax=Heligmosomoides polygyrus TaxID=6339 RepID=A0A183GBI1_HELPZ